MNEDKEIYSRKGFWSRTMGFIRCHLIAWLFVSEMVLVTVGVICMVVAVLSEGTSAVLWLLKAICFFLMSIWVLLGSIRLLLFYSQSLRRLKSAGTREQSSQPPAPADAQKGAAEP